METKSYLFSVSSYPFVGGEERRGRVVDGEEGDEEDEDMGKNLYFSRAYARITRVLFRENLYCLCISGGKPLIFRRLARESKSNLLSHCLPFPSPRNGGCVAQEHGANSLIG